ncbi:MAG: hypothetical protein CVV25_06645 [Ignavibacteriae bacterium HGW-Ignavibacteriae-4]|jgi:hypothetical protein|nr:MAG: hypothetical protein CVV25_06645 [Ignavibacteriae bacterium HGW-Ignavibacteriae-4]
MLQARANEDIIESTVSTEEYRRDSLYLYHTGQEFFKYSIDGFYFNLKKEYLRYKKENDSNLVYKIIPQKIFYNKDSTLLYSFVIYAVGLSEKAIWPEEYDHFSTVNMVGFRNSKCEPWKIYPFDVIGLYGAPNLDTLTKDLYKFYFKDISDKSYYLDTNGNGEFEYVKSKYNLGDVLFWEKFPEFQKGREGVDSLYSFQYEYDNPHVETFKMEGFRYFSKLVNSDSVEVINKNNPFDEFTVERQTYLLNQVKDLGLNLQYVSDSKDSLYLYLINRFSDKLVTLNDVIIKGIDYYTYKPEIDSVSYPDSLLKMYECK